MISEDKIAEIRDRAPIADVIGNYVVLKKSGNSLKGLCPFHNEKTPSFYVHPNRGFYHCFGCKASGDVFSFLMHVEGKTFPEVARDLAEQTGVQLPVYDPQREAEHQRYKKESERLASLMEAATEFYCDQLREHPDAGIARAELARRGISDESVQNFRLGYAPHGWDSLVRFFERAGSSPADAEAVGLIVSRRSGRGHYDRFRHRLMFPIADVHGKVVAFSGRALERAPSMEAQKDPPAKYLNSPENPLYHKGEVLYGLHEGRVEIRREDAAILCEGNFDLVALHQAGFAHAVAPMGTAFTEAHARLIKRFATKLFLLFDGDQAGRKAVREAYGVLTKTGLSAHAVTLPQSSDPDSFLREQGTDALRARVTNAPTIIEYLIDDAAGRVEPNPRAKAEAIGKLGPILAGVESPIERGLYVERVARKFGITDLALVRRELRRGLGRGNERRRTARDAVQQDIAPRVSELQSKLISALIDQPTLIQEEEAQKLPSLLTNKDLRAIFDSILRMVDSQGSLEVTALLEELQSNQLRPWLEEQLAVQRHSLEEARRIVCDGLPLLKQQNIERELPLLQQRIVEARRVGDDALAAGLTQEFVELSRSAHRLKQTNAKQR
ncbi:MAG: DNA primase [Myxococcales bacterium]|nr:DNA primase [Myxococcales bacterium]MDH3484938.1 DNA primase [Myxococcales bacterium]